MINLEPDSMLALQIISAAVNLPVDDVLNGIVRDYYRKTFGTEPIKISSQGRASVPVPEIFNIRSLN